MQGLKVVDSTAFSLCMDNRMPMVVFGMEPAGNITKALRGEKIGTLVTRDAAGQHRRTRSPPRAARRRRCAKQVRTARGVGHRAHDRAPRAVERRRFLLGAILALFSVAFIDTCPTGCDADVRRERPGRRRRDARRSSACSAPCSRIVLIVRRRRAWWLALTTLLLIVVGWIVVFVLYAAAIRVG